MDKYQLEQLKKLVMDLDRSLTRIKSFIDQNENEPGFDKLGDEFGFPPLPPRSRNSISDMGRMNSARKTDPFMVAPRASSQPVTNAPVMPVADSSNYAFRDTKSDGPVSAPQPLQKSTNTVLSPNTPTTSTAIPPLTPKETSENKPEQIQTPPQPLSSTPAAPATPEPVAQSKPDIDGTFDGQYLVSPTGEKIEVPASYAAKSRILFGDTVSAYNENGEQKFKVTTKQPRKSLKALTTKREGNWFVVTGLGGYRISDNAAEFNNLQINQEVNVLVPENNTSVPYATFDEIANVQKAVAPATSVSSSQPSRPAQTMPAPKRDFKPQQSKSFSNPVGNSSAQRQPNQPNARPSNSSNFPSGQNTQRTQNDAPSAAPIDPALRVIEDFDLV
jgi:hypothetical protein